MPAIVLYQIQFWNPVGVHQLLTQHIPTDSLAWMERDDLYQGTYVTYKGSLTTPPYTECVTWIIYEKPVQIGTEQVKEYDYFIVAILYNITHQAGDLGPFSDVWKLFLTVSGHAEIHYKSKTGINTSIG